MVDKLAQLLIGMALLTAAQAAMAERVYVKARGEVDLAPFHCENVARSVNVKRLCYDEREMYVLVSLKGIWYHFCAVPPATVNAWRKASSKGRYYNDNVRGSFDCQVTGAPVYR
jgi:KTSC domain